MTLPLPLKEPVPEREGHSDAWYTPAWVLELVSRQWPEGIDLDPAWHPACLVKARKTYTLKDNGLDHDWNGNVWNNPPYSDPKPWILKAGASVKHGAKTMQLLRFDPSVQYWNLIWQSATAIAVFRRRMTFIHGSGRKSTTANFPVCLVYWAGIGAPIDDLNRVWLESAQIIKWKHYSAWEGRSKK